MDAKLIRNDRARRQPSSVNSTADLADTIELANGCACEPSPHLTSAIRDTGYTAGLRACRAHEYGNDSACCS